MHSGSRLLEDGGVSERRGGSEADQLDDELQHVADQLYALKPEEFSAARDAAVRQARADKKTTLARELGKLRKPTQSAWLVNLLWRDQPDVMEQLFELARELGRAQADAAGPVLRELTAQRRQLESALARQAAGLAQTAGVHVSDAVMRETQETLGAAMAQPEVAEEVRSGRLVKPASYAGFGVLPASGPAKTPPKEPIDLQAAQRARKSSAEQAEAERRAEAQRRGEEARQALERAQAALAEQARAVEAAARRRDDLRQQLTALREQLQRLESQVETAEGEAKTATNDREVAERAAAEAREAFQRAEADASSQQ